MNERQNRGQEHVNMNMDYAMGGMQMHPGTGV